MQGTGSNVHQGFRSGKKCVIVKHPRSHCMDIWYCDLGPARRLSSRRLRTHCDSARMILAPAPKEGMFRNGIRKRVNEMGSYVRGYGIHSEFITDENVTEKLGNLDGLLVAPALGSVA